MWLSIIAPLLNREMHIKLQKSTALRKYCKCIDDQCSNAFTIEQDNRDETFADGDVAEDRCVISSLWLTSYNIQFFTFVCFIEFQLFWLEYILRVNRASYYSAQFLL